jgi:hypothetical protein
MAAALAAVAVGVAVPFVGAGIGLYDEGWLLTGVQRIVEGELLYRDLVRSYGPGLFYGLAAVFGPFRDDLIAMRVVLTLMLGALSSAVYLLARPGVPRGWAIAAALLPVVLAPPLHKAFVPLALVLSLHVCRGLVKSPSPRSFALAGLGFGVIALFRQEAGAYGLLIAALGALAWSGSRAAVVHAWLALGLGALCVWGPVLAIFAAAGGLGSLVDQLVLYGLQGNEALSVPMPGLAEVLRQPASASLFYVPTAAVGLGVCVAFVALRRSRDDVQGRLLAQWTAMALLGHSVFLSRSDLLHVRQVLVLPALVFVGALVCLAALRPALDATVAIRRAVALLLGAWLGAALWTGSGEHWRRFASLQRLVPLETPQGQLRVLPGQKVVEDLVAAVHARTAPGTPIFVVPYSPMLYFLSQRPNATRHDALIPELTTPAVEAEIIDTLEAGEVPLVIVNDLPFGGDPDHRFTRFAPTLADYVATHYAAVGEINSYQFFERRSEIREP